MDGMTHRNQGAKSPKTRGYTNHVAAARQVNLLRATLTHEADRREAFMRGKDWFLLRPTVRAVRLAVAVIRG